MKNLLLALSLVAMALSFSSCGNDEPEVPTSRESVNGIDLINTTINVANNTVNHIEYADYTFNIEREGYNQATVSIIARGVKFDQNMPLEATFRIQDIVTTNFNDYYVKFSALSVSYYNVNTGDEETRYKITNVKGYVDSHNKVFSLEYTVNDTWRVVVCSPIISTRVPDNDYSAPTDLFYTYSINIATMKAEVFIHNVQFTVNGATSPVLKKISIPNLDVNTSVDDNGLNFNFTGDNIVPVYYTGDNLDQGTPYPALVVTNFNSMIRVNSGYHHIYFNAHGGEHETTGEAYLWSWQPSGSVNQ